MLVSNNRSKGLRSLIILSIALGACSPESPSLSASSDLETEMDGRPNLTIVGPSEELLPDPLEGEIQHIYGGSAPTEPYHRAVVALHQRSSSGVSASPFCSGTLITTNVVLTAAHCLDTAKGGGSFRTMRPSDLAIYVGDGVASDPNPSVYAVTETSINSLYNRRSLANDIALVRLSVSVPSSEAEPVPALPSALSLNNSDIRVSLNFAGFGYDEDRNFGVKLQTNVPLAGFGCVVNGCGSLGDPAVMFSYSQPTAGTCNGDSGGPAFIIRNGIPYVAGMTSFGDRDCVIYGVSSRADAFESYIQDFTGVTPPPVLCVADDICDESCANDPDCQSLGGETAAGELAGETAAGDSMSSVCGDGICDADESCDGRRGTVRCSRDCDGVTNGRPTRRYCYVGDTCEGSGCR